MTATTYLGYVRTGKEFEVEAALAEIDIQAYCARKMHFIRRGKQRRAEAETVPYLPNYIFIDLTPDRFLDAIAVKYLASTLTPLGRADIRPLESFKRAVAKEYAAQERKKLNQEAISEYTPGQALRFLDGRFADQMLTFRAIVERSHDLHPKIKAEMEMMGRNVVVEVDPLDVRAAE